MEGAGASAREKYIGSRKPVQVNSFLELVFGRKYRMLNIVTNNKDLIYTVLVELSLLQYGKKSALK